MSAEPGREQRSSANRLVQEKQEAIRGKRETPLVDTLYILSKNRGSKTHVMKTKAPQSKAENGDYHLIDFCKRHNNTG